MSHHDPAESLPAEIFEQILGYLDAIDLTHSAAVTKAWKTYASDSILWQSLCRQRWQGKRYMRRAYRIGTPFQKRSLFVAKVLWRDKPEKWKWAYGKVEVEAVRTQTHESEIVESYWKFTVPVPPERSSW
jgi:hypothetical protein